MLLIDFNSYCQSIAAAGNPVALKALDVNLFVLRREHLYMAFVTIFFLPILTMRLIAEEKKNRTIELLMTSPISSLDIVLGKYFAATILWIFILAITFIYPMLIKNLPEIQIDWGTYLASTLGLFLFGALGIAIGLLASSLTENQLISAIIGFALCAILYFLYNLYQVTDSTLSQLFYDFSSISHYLDFYKGVIDTSNIVYFVTAILFTLFVAERILESQRWR
jgi:ABC-2 type transport system permease protein